MKNKNKRILSKFFKTENNTNKQYQCFFVGFFCKFTFCVVSFAIYTVKQSLRLYRCLSSRPTQLRRGQCVLEESNHGEQNQGSVLSAWGHARGSSKLTPVCPPVHSPGVTRVRLFEALQPWRPRQVEERGRKQTNLNLQW